MPASHVAILYSVAQRRRRVLIVPDDDAQLAAIKARPGEKLILQPIDDYEQRGPDAAVADDAGGPPLPHRCAIVDEAGDVIGHCAADPGIDVIAERTLHLSEVSKEGDVLDGGMIKRRYAEIDEGGRVEKIVLHNPETPPELRAGAKLIIEAGELKPGDIIDRSKYDEPPVGIDDSGIGVPRQ
jgi:hypothetical protein